MSKFSCGNAVPMRSRPTTQLLFTRYRYTLQMSRALLDTCCSAYFTMSNGVKQGGGVLSAILFTIYIDKLMCKQKLSGLGCRMGNSYVGALLYADDIALLCPIV